MPEGQDPKLAALAEALERLDEGEGIVVYGSDGRLLYANAPACRLLGLSRRSLDGLTRGEIERALARLGARIVSASHVPASDVPVRRIERHARRLPGGGRLELYRDATPERDAAARREAYLGIALHDLRSPLASIRSYAYLLSTKFGREDQRVTRAAEVILRATDRALGLIQDFLDAELADVGLLESHPERQPLLPAMEEALSELRAEAALEGVALEAALPASLPSLAIDRVRLAHALRALLEQGLGRSHPGARLSLHVEVRAAEVWIGVTDHGPELGDRALEHAFDRDLRAAQERRLATPLGVALAHAAIAAHGGTMGVATSPAATTFYLTLPLATAEERTPAQPRPSP